MTNQVVKMTDLTTQILHNCMLLVHLYRVRRGRWGARVCPGFGLDWARSGSPLDWLRLCRLRVHSVCTQAGLLVAGADKRTVGVWQE
jgi:hypothetical protein